MRSPTLAFTTLVTAFCLTASGAAFGHDVGAVLKVKHDAFGTTANAARQAKAPDDAVSDQELLETDAASRLSVQLADGSTMALGPDSKTRVDAFAYTAATAGGSAMGSARIFVPLGTLRYASGAMPDGMTKIDTPAAEVTLHGTKLKVQVSPRGYTRIAVEQGSIRVRSKYTGESIEVAAGDSVTILPEGIRDGSMSIDRPASFGTVADRRGEHAGRSGGESGGGESGGESGGGESGGGDSGPID